MLIKTNQSWALSAEKVAVLISNPDLLTMTVNTLNIMLDINHGNVFSLIMGRSRKKLTQYIVTHSCFQQIFTTHKSIHLGTRKFNQT